MFSRQVNNVPQSINSIITISVLTIYPTCLYLHVIRSLFNNTRSSCLCTASVRPPVYIFLSEEKKITSRYLRQISITSGRCNHLPNPFLSHVFIIVLPATSFHTQLQCVIILLTDFTITHSVALSVSFTPCWRPTFSINPSSTDCYEGYLPDCLHGLYISFRISRV